MQINSQDILESLIAKWGFLPFFRNRIESFSIEEYTPEELWFNDEHPGPWEWKGPVIAKWQSAYGKFFEKKAGFVSLDWFPDFMNWRRSRYPIDSMPEDAKHILEVLNNCESALSKDLKKMSGFTLARRRTRKDPDDPFGTIKNERNGADFDKLIAQLQIGTWVCIADFEYLVSKEGERYGWGVARYCTPEAMYEINIDKAVEGRSPQESKDRIIRHVKELFPDADEKQIQKLIL